MAGDDRWRYDDRYRGDDRHRFESPRRYESDDRDGTHRREADETFGRSSHDYPAGTFGRRGGTGEEEAHRDRYARRDRGDDEYRPGRPGDRDGEEGRRSATEMAFGRGQASEGRDYRPGDFSRNYDRDHRGMLERAGDEIASWFGGDDADHSRHGEGHRGRGPKSYQRSDERIREDVNDRLTEDPWLDASEIEVEVQSREVTLSGMVRSRRDKRRAEDIADSVSGVTHVQNNLRVHDAGADWSRHQQRPREWASSANMATGAARTTTAAPPAEPDAPEAGGIGAKLP
jgi:osmotically-inducible protein OsmY